jgi:flagellar assembly protein FliH
MSSHEDGQQANACSRWDIPQIDEQLASVGGNGGRARQAGYEEGFAQGREEALAAGRREVEAQVAVLTRLVQSLAKPFEELDESVETELLSLATTIARQVVRRELQTDPQLVLAVIRESIGLLPVATREITLKLHPEDARLVREYESAAIEEGQWRILEDANRARGDCIVSTGHARIDASLNEQVTRIANAVLGAGDGGSVES